MVPGELEPAAPGSRDEVTDLLLQWQAGDSSAAERLMPLVYRELRAIAQRRLRRERPDHTLQPTAVVHEAFLRLVDQPRVAWQGRAHFFRAAAQIMRNLLVDSARARNAAKRGGGNEHVELDDVRAGTRGPSVDVMALDVMALDLALEKLARIDPDRAALVELRFFAGLTFEETAEAMGTSLSTVKRQWNAIRVWLLRELAGTAREATGPLGVQPGQERGAP